MTRNEFIKELQNIAFQSRGRVLPEEDIDYTLSIKIYLPFDKLITLYKEFLKFENLTTREAITFLNYIDYNVHLYGEAVYEQTIKMLKNSKTFNFRLLWAYLDILHKVNRVPDLNSFEEVINIIGNSKLFKWEKLQEEVLKYSEFFKEKMNKNQAKKILYRIRRCNEVF